jgi:hypothetical protein
VTGARPPLSEGELRGKLREVRDIRDALLAGGYDGSEGERNSPDMTWTDFGIAVGAAEYALEEVERLRRVSAGMIQVVEAAGPVVRRWRGGKSCPDEIALLSVALAALDSTKEPE